MVERNTGRKGSEGTQLTPGSGTTETTGEETDREIGNTGESGEMRRQNGIKDESPVTAGDDCSLEHLGWLKRELLRPPQGRRGKG